MVDDAVRVVQSHRARIEADLANTVINVARIFYLREHKMEYVSYTTMTRTPD
jgi:hypothetical protein